LDWRCETPKSPPGDYKVPFVLVTDARCQCEMCETPKSPPGDYKPRTDVATYPNPAPGVKHLNPRQGITRDLRQHPLVHRLQRRVKHLNPRQGITRRVTRWRRHRARIEV